MGYFFCAVFGFSIGMIVGGSVVQSCFYEPLRSKCIKRHTAECQRSSPDDTAAYLECLKPISAECR
jgi:hypothetical protein